MAEKNRQQVLGANTQSVFREFNEQIERGNDAHALDGELLCECATRDCTTSIPLTRAEYEAVRRVPTHYFVAPGHVVAAIERAIEENERYTVVEKFGDGGIRAAQLDPRGGHETAVRR